jgi:DNA-directed RNA polymerase subunit E'/Rpb7
MSIISLVSTINDKKIPNVSDDIYFKSVLSSNVVISPTMFLMGFDKAILKQLKKNIEGYCMMNGYIKPDSVKLLSRSKGYSIPGNFNGNIEYSVKYEAELCNPIKDQIIKCVVLDINKMGILAKATPLEIIIIKELHKNKSEFSKIKIGDMIDVKVIEKKFMFRDRKIDVIGILASDENAKPKSKSQSENKLELKISKSNSKPNSTDDDNNVNDSDIDNNNDDVFDVVEDITVQNTSSDIVDSIADDLSTTKDVEKMSLVN